MLSARASSRLEVIDSRPTVGKEVVHGSCTLKTALEVHCDCDDAGLVPELDTDPSQRVDYSRLAGIVAAPSAPHLVGGYQPALVLQRPYPLIEAKVAAVGVCGGQ